MDVAITGRLFITGKHEQCHKGGFTIQNDPAGPCPRRTGPGREACEALVEVPEGERIEFPAKKVSSVTFGGITTRTSNSRR